MVDTYQESVDKNVGQKVSDLFELEALGTTELDSLHETFVKDIMSESNYYTMKLRWREIMMLYR